MELRVLQAEIDARILQITSSTPGWPCQKGCDGCCRALAAVPHASALEWTLIEAALEHLPETERAEIRQRIAALESNTSRPITCPFLDDERGTCMIYAYRPTACRTYGFYVERDRGLFCGIIEQQVDRGIYQHVVWGNHAALEARLAPLGAPIDLVTWFRQTSAATRRPAAADRR